MTTEVLALLKIIEDSSGGRLLLAPTVGLFRGALPEGAGVVPGQRIGTIGILGRTHSLLAPPEAWGRVLDCRFPPGLHAVAYGEELFRLGEEPAVTKTAGTIGSAADAWGDPEEGGARRITVKSPTEGVFYRRPDPKSPPYVEVGAVVETGHALGMVEVMKCFNQVRYGGPGLPERARVVSVPVEDSAEIRQGQVLFVLEPAG